MTVDNSAKPSFSHIDIGKNGEAAAKIYLERKGHKIVAQNWKTKYGEVDLITMHRGILVFVEVRSKSNEQFGIPEESINRKKQMKLMRNAKAYVANTRYKGSYRIDAVCVVFSQNQEINRLNHYENICG